MKSQIEYKLTIVFTVLSLFAGVVSTSPKGKLRLIGADKLEQFTRNGVSIKKLTGNVHFKKGEVDLKCDLAYWFEKEERADFYHNVTVTKLSLIHI